MEREGSPWTEDMDDPQRMFVRELIRQLCPIGCELPPEMALAGYQAEMRAAQAWRKAAAVVDRIKAVDLALRRERIRIANAALDRALRRIYYVSPTEPWCSAHAK